jgi:hypothetical protein
LHDKPLAAAVVLIAAVEVAAAAIVLGEAAKLMALHVFLSYTSRTLTGIENWEAKWGFQHC